MATHLRIIGKNIHLNTGELEWLEHMQKMFGCNEQEALDEIIKYKRENAFVFERQGKFELAKLLLTEIDEWDDNREQDYKNASIEDIKIIVP